MNIGEMTGFNSMVETGHKILKAVATVAAMTVWLSGLIMSVIAGMIDDLLARITEFDASTLEAKGVDLESFANAAIASVHWIGYVNAIIPLTEMILLTGAYFTGWTALIALRWIKSFIPTIAN